MLNTLPLLDLKPLQQVAPYYFDWLRHPPEDSWWNWSELQDKYPRTTAAVLNLSAWYDDNYGPEGATTNYAGLLEIPSREIKTPRLTFYWDRGFTGVQQLTDRENVSSARLRPSTTTMSFCAGWITT